MKICTRCGIGKLACEFRPQRRACRSCGYAEHKVWYARNRDTAIATNIRWNRENKERVNKNAVAWRKLNSDRLRKERIADKTAINARARVWNSNNKDKRREYHRKWSTRNMGVIANYAASRRAKKLIATPPWADKSGIKQTYLEADFVGWATGVPRHVDHIYPLVHKKFCGLHVPWNLQILTASENMSKGNRICPVVSA